MVNTINDAQGAQIVNDSTTLFVAKTGVVEAITAVAFATGSDPGRATIQGAVIGINFGVVIDGNDHVTVADGGLVGGFDGAGADGFIIFGTGNTVNVSGTVQANDSGFFMNPDSTSTVNISKGGTVIGGSGGQGNEGSAYSAAIGTATGTFVLNNAGTIIGEFNPLIERAIAIGVGAFIASGSGLIQAQDWLRKSIIPA